eukprot:4978496-Pyramimonas_sp.AAC.1
MRHQIRFQLLCSVLRLRQQPSASPDFAPRLIPPFHFLQHPQDTRPVCLLQPPTIVRTIACAPGARCPCHLALHFPCAAGSCTCTSRSSTVLALSFAEAQTSAQSHAVGGQS